MKKIGAIFLCFVVIICVFRATDFSFEEYINYVEENFPKYKPTFFKPKMGDEVLVATSQVASDYILAHLEVRYNLPSGSSWTTIRKNIIDNRHYFEEFYVIEEEVKRSNFYLFPINEYYIRLNNLDYPRADIIPMYEYEVVDVEDGPDSVLEYLDGIYVFIKGVFTVPIWLIHCIGVLSYGVFAS